MPKPTTKPDSLMTELQSMERARETVHAIISQEERAASSSAITVATYLGADIIEEVAHQGSDLNSVELARRYGTSRTPVREALMLLEKQGLVQILPRRRPRVGVVDIDRAREIFRARAVLMESLAPEIIRLGTDEDLDRLESETSRMEAALQCGDRRAFFWANTEFHILNLHAARNSTITEIVSALLLRSMWLRRRTLDVPRRREESLDEHRRLCRAYRAGDVEMSRLLNRLIHLGALRALEDSQQS